MQIFLIILFILLCILALPIKLKITHNGEFFVSLQILFLNFKLLPKKERTTRMTSKRFSEELKKQKRKKKRKKLFTSSKSSKHPTSISSQDIPFYFDVIKKFIAKSYTSTRKGLTIKITKLQISIGTGDAAKTAIAYGIVSQSVSYFLEFCEQVANLKISPKSKIDINTDFLSSKSTFLAQITLKWRLYRAALIALSVFRNFFVAYLSHKNHSQKKTTISNKTITEEK